MNQNAIENQNDKREIPTRFHLVICTMITGFMAAAAITLSIYTYISTPEIHEVPVYVNHEFRGMQDKVTNLIAFPTFSFFAFFALAYNLFRWKKFLAKALERQAMYESRSSPLAGINLRILLLVSAACFCFFGGIGLYYTVSRCFSLLGWPTLPLTDSDVGLLSILFTIGLIAITVAKGKRNN